jgi:hypothetical protein
MSSVTMPRKSLNVCPKTGAPLSVSNVTLRKSLIFPESTVITCQLLMEKGEKRSFFPVRD